MPLAHLDGHQCPVPHPAVHFAKGAPPHQGTQPHIIKGQRILSSAGMRNPAGSKLAWGLAIAGVFFGR